MGQDALIEISNLAEVEVNLQPEAIQARDALLVRLSQATEVTDELDADYAADVLKEVTVAVKDMEATRKEVKAPVLDLGKRIDATAKDFATSLKSEKTRIEKMLGSWEANQRRIREEAQRKEREAQEAARKEAEQALAEGDDEAAAKAADKIAESKAVVEASAHRPEGTAVRETYKFEVENLDALFKAAPHLCKIEPDNTAIRAAIKKSQSIAGLRIWKEAKSYVR